MSFARQVVAWGYGLSMVALLESAFFVPSRVAVFFLISFVLAVLVSYYGLKPEGSRRDYRFALAVFGLLFSSWGVLFFVSSVWLVHLLALVTGFLSALYVQAVAYFLYAPKQYQSYSIDNTGTYIGILSVFFSSASLYGLSVFLPQPFWVILGLGFLIFWFFTYLVMWANKVAREAGLYHVFLISFLLLSMSWLVGMYPIHLFVQAALVTFVFYFLTGVYRAHFQNRLDGGVISKYALVSVLGVIALVLSARWA